MLRKNKQKQNGKEKKSKEPAMCLSIRPGTSVDGDTKRTGIPLRAKITASSLKNLWRTAAYVSYGYPPPSQMREMLSLDREEHAS